MQSYIVLSFGKVCSACALRVASTTHALTLRAFGKIEWSSNILMLSHKGRKYLLRPFHLKNLKKNYVATLHDYNLMLCSLVKVGKNMVFLNPIKGSQKMSLLTLMTLF
jgi:hypothetical protein